VARKNSFRKQKVSIPFDYGMLNSSYATRVIPLSTDYIGSYSQKESLSNNPNQDPGISKVIIDNRTFYEKRIEKLEEELEDERRTSLTEKDIFLSKINELEYALKSRVQPQVYFAKTLSQRILYHQAPPFKPITVTTPDTNNTIPFVSIKSDEAPKSAVKIVEIFP